MSALAPYNFEFLIKLDYNHKFNPIFQNKGRYLFVTKIQFQKRYQYELETLLGAKQGK